MANYFLRIKAKLNGDERVEKVTLERHHGNFPIDEELTGDIGLYPTITEKHIETKG